MARRKKNKFRRQLLIFALILLIIGELILIYVNKSLLAYEKGNVNNYMDGLVTDIKNAALKGNIDKYIELSSNDKSSYEKSSSLKEGYKTLFKEADKISYQKSNETKDTYDIFVDDLKVATVKLDGSKQEHRLGILNFTAWEVDEIKGYNEDGIYNLDFYLTSDLKLSINGIDVKKEDLVGNEAIEGFEDFKGIVDMPLLNHYKISHLTKKPNIKVVDSKGNEIKYEVIDNKYYANNYYKTDSEQDAMKKLKHTFDTMAFAEMWSKFLTKDLTGSWHGLYQLTPNLIEKTNMYQSAYNWAHNVDITFTSNHYLATPAFTNEKLSNFTVYNENMFSVEVYLEKNMVLTRSGEKRVSVMHDMLYFAYHDGAYRLSKLQSIVE